LEEVPNYVMVEMLKYASGSLGLKSEVGGKTGTTNDYVDGWFVGITPSLVVGTWVGGEDHWIRFLTLANGQGSRMAKPFFIALIKSLEDDPEADYDTNARFHKPEGDIDIELDCGQYDLMETVENVQETDDFSEDAFGDEDLQKSDTIKNKPLLEHKRDN